MSAVWEHGRGRATSLGLLVLCHRRAALQLAPGLYTYERWIAPELHPADKPSRRFEVQQRLSVAVDLCGPTPQPFRSQVEHGDEAADETAELVRSSPW